MTDVKTNAFVEAIKNINPYSLKENEILTENGAIQLKSSGSNIVDQFGKAGNYRGRSIDDVWDEQNEIWNENSEAALRFPFYLRMITRKVKINDKNTTDKTQSGQGARDESFKRLLWIAETHPNDFYKNIFMLPLVGSWKDLWVLMFLDETEGTSCLNHDALFELMSSGLQSETHVDLIKKFMPRIKSNNKCTTTWTTLTNKYAKEFASYLNISWKEYNKLKTSGKAHDFQKIICSGNYDKIKWNMIPGRALSLLVNGKFLANHNLKESYTNWILKQPTAKFTGYVFELAKRLRKLGVVGGMCYHHVEIPIEIKHTIDAQFNQVVETALNGGKIKENVLCCLDTSGSMQQQVNGLPNVMCCDIATSLALFFAKINKGAFHNVLMRFDSNSYPVTLESESFCENLTKLPSCPCGTTNFQSVIDEIVKIRKEKPEIPLEDYATVILAVSDMQFDRPYSFRRMEMSNKTNQTEAREKLLEVFPKEFVDKVRFIWWDVASRYGTNGFESTSSDDGSMYISGFDGSVMNLLLGEDEDEEQEGKENTEIKRLTPEDLVKKALSQEILSYISLAE